MNLQHGVKAHLFIPAAFVFILLLLALGIGCARNKGPEPEPLAVKVKLDKTTYQPGEAVRATVTVQNNTGSPLTLNGLNAQNVLFVYGKRGEPERVEQRAVASENENMDEPLVLEPDQPAERTFLLTRLTEFSGPMVLQVQYEPGPLASKLPPKIYSNPPEFEVKGKPLFKRDSGGFIAKEDAIAAAGRAAGAPVESAEAIFVRDEKGFYKWWVNLKLKGVAEKKSWFIDPYLGTPWHQAKPFDPKLAVDPRFVRPPSLQPLRIPSDQNANPNNSSGTQNP